MTRIRTVGAVAAAVLLSLGAGAPPVEAGEGADEERLRRLEDLVRRQASDLERLRGEIATERASRSPDTLTSDEIDRAVGAYLAATGAGAVPVLAPPPASGGVRIGGYLHAVYLAPSDEHSHFDLHRLILSGDAEISRGIDFSFEIEFEHGGISDEVPGEIVIEKAEVAFRLSDAFTPLVGAILVPFGRYNLHHDDPMNDFTERPFTGRVLMPTGFGQPGIGVEGAAPFGGGHVFAYKAALTNGYRDDFTADEGVREARQPWDEDENEGKQAWARAAATWRTCFFDTLETGVSGTWAKYDAEDRNDLFGWGFDLLARKGPFELSGEVLGYSYERDPADPAGSITGQWGAYAQLAYHFFPGFWRCARPHALLSDTSLFTLAVRGQHMDLDDHVKGATFEDDLTAWTVGLNYRVTERTVFRVDYSWFLPELGPERTLFAASFSTYF